MKPAFVAFYSFKGGVGRSLALCNLAWSLSRRGRRVLVIDLDLEAPSIDRVRALAPRKGTEPGPGAVELITHYAATGELADLGVHTYELPTGDPTGRLWIMPAGLRDGAYQESLARLDWSNLHPEGGSERFVADLRAKAAETFLPHYVLIDSRTGFSDIGGFTTHLLADQVVLVFNLTRACIEGTIQAYRSMITRPEAPHFILVASPVPPVADEAGTLIEKRLAAAGEHMERGLIYRQAIVRIDYDARMVLTDELAVTEPEKYGAAARYDKLRDLIQRANPHEVYPAADDAARHLREGRASEAIEALRAFVEEHPDNAEGFAALGGLYRMLNRPEARDAFERAVALAPGLPDGHRGLGEIDLAAGAAASAIEALKRAEAQGDRSPGLYRALCAAYDAERQIAPRRDAGAKLIAAIVREMNDSTEPEPLDSERPITDLRSELIEHLSRFPPYRGFSAEDFWSAVMGSLGMKRADKHGTIRRASSGELAEPQLREMVAALAAERARAVHDYGPDIDRLMEIIARIGGDIDDRERLLEKCTEPRLRAVTCAWLAFRVRGEARCTELEQALRIDESYIPARRLLAATIRRLPKPSIEQLQSAIDHYRIVLGRDPRPGTWFGFGVALNDLANLDSQHAPALRRAASSAYAAVVDREPHNYGALFNWALALGRLASEAEGDERRALLHEACDRYRRAVDVKPDYHGALNNWGVALDDLAAEAEGDARRTLLRDACDRYRRAVDGKLDSHKALNNWGNALGRLANEAEGDERRALLRDACDRYRLAVDVKPDDHEVLKNWGITLLHLATESEGEERMALLHEARRRCEQANAIKPHAGDYNLACALSLLGRFNEAWALLPGVLERGDEKREHVLADSDLAPLWAAHPEWRAVIEGG